LDLRVRRALVHTIDRQALVDGLYDGDGRTPDTFIAPEEIYFPEVDRAITKYAYDPRRGEQLMLEAGLAKDRDDRDGLFVRPGGERFQPEYQTLAGTVFERGQAIVAETWRRAGFDAKTSVLPAAQVRDHQVRHTFPGISTLGTAAPDIFLGHESGTAATRWVGQNRGGWVNAEYDQLWQVYATTLDRSKRHVPLVQMMKIASDEVPGFPLYYNVQPTFAHLATVRGPHVGVAGTTGFWNLKDWTLG
jgi:peptide/nickel transport system substrate-binding protein